MYYQRKYHTPILYLNQNKKESTDKVGLYLYYTQKSLYTNSVIFFLLNLIDTICLLIQRNIPP